MVDPVSLAVVGGTTLLGSLLGYGSARKSSEENRENSLEVLQKEQDYNDYLLGHQKQLMMQDAKDAGMSPTFAQGSILGASSSSPSVSPGSSVPYDYSLLGSSGSNIAALLQQKPLVEANARKLNADARAQELSNKDKEERNKVLGSHDEFLSIDPDSRVPITNLDEWSNNHPGQLPETVVISVPGSDGSEGRFNARQVIKRWERELSDINASMLVNDLNSKVTSGQISDPDVIESLVSMPYKHWENLVAQIKSSLANASYTRKNEQLLDVEIAVADLDRQIRKDSNIYQYINKIFDKDFEIKDLAKILVMSFVGLVQNIGGLSSAIRR